MITFLLARFLNEFVLDRSIRLPLTIVNSFDFALVSVALYANVFLNKLTLGGLIELYDQASPEEKQWLSEYIGKCFQQQTRITLSYINKESFSKIYKILFISAIF